ncbi:MAG: adenylosuccinate lyase [Saprospiraceae bacterium]
MSNAIGPIDGRYYEKLKHLSKYFSENALFKYRSKVEVLYFIELLEKTLGHKLTNSKKVELNKIFENFSSTDALKIKSIEKITRHDVKAIEYFIKEKIQEHSLKKYVEFVHFGLTSQDINNTAIPMLLKDACIDEFIPKIEELIKKIKSIAFQYRKLAMLARTHGQAASPTSLGKEMYVFVERLNYQLIKLKSFKYSGKFGGATGNFNAHSVAYPKVNWKKWSDRFLKTKLGLERQQTTTQIAHYDEIAEWCHIVLRLNTILLDFSKDIWSYISIDYFTQVAKANEVGSSAMPHKVNPIDFENAEGNLGIANSLFSHLAEKLPISRLQRDLTDSTVLRNIGNPIAHSYLAYLSLLSGLDKIAANPVKIKLDLERNWIILAEPIQTILRREGISGAYEILKDLTRGKSEVSKSDIHQFIDGLKLDQAVVKELKQLTPFNYVGYSFKF